MGQGMWVGWAGWRPRKAGQAALEAASLHSAIVLLIATRGRPASRRGLLGNGNPARGSATSPPPSVRRTFPPPPLPLADVPIVSLLLAEGANVAAQDGVGASPLIMAAYKGHTQVTTCVCVGVGVGCQGEGGRGWRGHGWGVEARGEGPGLDILFWRGGRCAQRWVAGVA